MNIAIFGATSAIAQAVSKIYAGRSSSFVLFARDETKLADIKADLLARGASQVECQAADLADLAILPKLVKQAFSIFATLDLAFIAHGTLPDQNSCQLDFAETHKAINLNFLSPVAICTELAKQFEQQKSGTIAVISSVAGDRGRQSNYVYGSAKGALSIFLQGLRNRLSKDQVSVLTVKPGFVDTPMTAHLKKGPLFVGPDQIASGLVKAIDSKKNEVYIPGFWYLIMLAIKSIPECIFKKMKL